MTDSSRKPRWAGWLAATLVLIVVVAAVWSIRAASPAAESGRATPPPATVQYRMAQVKTATPAATATAGVTATQAPQVATAAATPTLVATLPAPPTSSALAAMNEVPRISVEVARAEVEAGRAVFVDVRTAATYKQGHLPGAVLLPGGVSSTSYAELPDDRLLIFYCA